MSERASVCGRVDCDRPAAFTPVLLMWVHKDHDPLEGHLGLKVCAHHAETATLADFMDENGFAVVCQNMLARGLQAPKRGLTELRMDRLQ